MATGAIAHAKQGDGQQKTRISCEDGQYMMHMWILEQEGEVLREPEKVLKVNRFATLATHNREHLSIGKREARKSARS